MWFSDKKGVPGSLARPVYEEVKKYFPNEDFYWGETAFGSRFLFYNKKLWVDFHGYNIHNVTITGVTSEDYKELENKNEFDEIIYPAWFSENDCIVYKKGQKEHFKQLMDSLKKYKCVKRIIAQYMLNKLEV